MNTSNRRNRWRSGLLLALVAVTAAACAEDKPLNIFEPQGPQADRIHGNTMFILWMATAVFVATFAGAGYIIWKNRVSEEEFNDGEFPEQVHGNPTLEWGWTALPGLILAVVAVVTVPTIFALEEKNEADELDVVVIGQQWWWEYRYDVDGDGFFIDGNGDGVVDELDEGLPLEFSLDPDDVSTAQEMVIPVGQQVDLLITSRDVIHSYWIPRLNGKRDAVPGRLHTWSLEADEAGEYTGWCTEYCGLSHARMRMAVIALPQDDFDAWLANQMLPAAQPDPSDELAIAGKELFGQQCASCHVVDDPDFSYPTILRDSLGDPVLDDEGHEIPTSVFVSPQVSKAAPNLTHFASRSAFGGAIYSQYAELDANDDDLNDRGIETYNDLDATYRWNTAQLRRWIVNAPSQKDMAPDDRRGMPSFALSDEQLNQLVAYLATLD